MTKKVRPTVVVIAVLTAVLILIYMGSLTSHFINNPSETTWAKKHLSSNLPDGWKIDQMKASGKRYGHYPVYVWIYRPDKSFTDGRELYGFATMFWFNKSGQCVFDPIERVGWDKLDMWVRGGGDAV